MSITPDRLIDDIYEAAIIPERWGSVLGDLAQMVEAWGGNLWAINAHQQRSWTASERMIAPMRQFIEGGYEKHNVRPHRALAKRHAGFVSDLDIMTLEEIENDPIYVNVLRPAGLKWDAGSVVPIPSADFLVFSFDRRAERGPFEPSVLRLLDRFRPHLARAGLIAARLQMQLVQAATQTMTMLGLPGCVLAAAGRVVMMNSLLEELSPRIFTRAHDRIALAHRPASLLLDEALARLRSSSATWSIAVPADEQHPPLVVHVLPIRRAANEIFGGAMALLVVTPVGAIPAPHADLLSGLFDLSPAESKVAASLAGGLTIKKYAENQDISHETVRSQLQSVMRKTGTARQVDLVRLLASVSPLAEGK